MHDGGKPSLMVIEFKKKINQTCIMKTRQKSSFLLTVHFISICVFSNRDLVEEEDKEVPLENLERRCAEPLEHTHTYLHKHGNTNLALSLIMNQCGSRVESGWCLLLNDRPICSSLHSLLKEEMGKKTKTVESLMFELWVVFHLRTSSPDRALQDKMVLQDPPEIR